MRIEHGLHIYTNNSFEMPAAESQGHLDPQAPVYVERKRGGANSEV